MKKLEHEKNWLIRSSGKLLGPFSQEIIEEQLSTRELVVIDEVSEPSGQWKPIRDKKEFTKIVEVLRLKTIEASEGTDVFGLDDSRTMNIYGDDKPEEKELVIESIRVNTSNNSDESVKTYGVNASQEAILKAKERTGRLWRLAALSLIFVVSAFLYKRTIYDSNKQILSADEYIELAERELQIGNYPLALNHYKEAYDLQSENLSIHLYLGILLIQVDQNYLLGRRLLNKIIELNGPFIKLAQTGIGLSYMQERDFESAESHLQNAISLDQNYAPAFANLGVLKLYEEKFNESIEYLKAAIEEGGEKHGARLMLTLAYLKKWELRPKLEVLVEAQKSIIKNTESQNPYLQQSLLLQTYIESMLGDRFIKEKEIFRILNVPPNFTESFKKNVFVDRQVINWDSIKPWCEMVVMKSKNKYSIPLNAYCEIKVGNISKALIGLEAAMLKHPNNSLILTLHSYALYESGRQSEGKVSSERAVEKDKDESIVLTYLVQANYCQRSGNLECQKLNYDKVQSIEKNNIVALTGMATYFLEKGDADNANKLYKSATEISKDYIPLLKLALEM